jgi:hypothetical protein
MVLVGDGKITVWCLLGRKAGDNTQVLALARELGFDFVEKHILAQPWELATHLGLRITLAGIFCRSRIISCTIPCHCTACRKEHWPLLPSGWSPNWWVCPVPG